MKTKSNSLFSLLCVGISALIIPLPVSIWGQSLTTISISPTIGPYNKTQQFVNDVSYALRMGLPSYGMFTAIPSGSSVNITNAFNTGSGGQAVFLHWQSPALCHSR